MDDAHLMNENNIDTGVIFGAYGPDEWLASSFMRSSLENNRNTLAQEGTWMIDVTIQLRDWVTDLTERYNFFSPNRAVMLFPWGMVEAALQRGKLDLELNGDPKEVKAFVERMDGMYKRAENLIEWVYNERGNSINVPLNFRPAINSAYPWLPKPLPEYIDEYLNSSASVLILIGPPGTGKTTFIKNLIHRSGGDAKVTYDERVMNSDGIFANFIESDTRFMIMEDADTFLKARTDGNTMMHRFLNVSDGLISAEGKKLVFSTNLPSIRDIDEALMRPGRCFDVVEFRPMTRAEALNVASDVGIDLRDGSEFTLAEIFGQRVSVQRRTRKIGF
jgi:molybdopterin-guanine dinucleotide biosynthesis protein